MFYLLTFLALGALLIFGFFSLAPFLLPLILILWAVSLFTRPHVRVYTKTYTNKSAHGGQYDLFMNQTQTWSQNNTTKQIETRPPKEGSIDVEFTEHESED